jgi:hypothetical protein
MPHRIENNEPVFRRYRNENRNKSNGVVYTPSETACYIASRMIRHSNLPYSCRTEVSILDPAAGEGELLAAMIKAVIPFCGRIRAVGYDTDETAGKKARLRISKMFPDVEIEIRNRDFLAEAEQGAIEKFDFVIANPPYIRTQIIGSERSRRIAEKLSLKGRVDLYYAFLVHAGTVLKQDGTAGYITSNKFMTVGAGASVRKYMLDHYRLHSITDLGDTGLFSASVLPCILIFSLGETSCGGSVSFTSVYRSGSQSEPAGCSQTAGIYDSIEKNGSFRLPDGRIFSFRQGTLKYREKGGLWLIDTDENRKWLAEVRSNTRMHFSDLGKIRVGIKTTADSVFIGDDWSGEKEGIELLRPLITHRNAGRIVAGADLPEWKVLYTHTSLNGRKTVCSLDDYPKSRAYLMKHYGRLSQRKYIAGSGRKWYEIWVPHHPDSWKQRKIVFRDISDRPQFWLDESGAVVNGDCYWIELGDRIADDLISLALAVANSSFIEKYYDLEFNNRLYCGKRRYQTQYVAEFPLPDISSDEAMQAIAIVKKITASKDPGLFDLYRDRLDELVEKSFINPHFTNEKNAE